MLLTLALVALLLVTVAGTFGTLIDSAIRACHAYPKLRDAARVSHVLVPQARRLEKIALAPLPNVRPASPARAKRTDKSLRALRNRAIVAA